VSTPKTKGKKPTPKTKAPRRRRLLRRVVAQVKRWLEGEGEGTWRSAGGVVVDEHGAVALIRQGERWTFPKGRLDPGEAINQAARREVYEEAGLRARITTYLGVLPGERHETHYFLMRLEQDLGIHDDEADEVRFFKPSKAKQKLSSRRDRRVLRRAVRSMEGHEHPDPVIDT
jgi:8-oxo-dGTP pyrophosphatase MutT (NUDIX family)